VDRLEEKRKIKAQAFHERKVCVDAGCECTQTLIRTLDCGCQAPPKGHLRHLFREAYTVGLLEGKTCRLRAIDHYTIAIRYAP
jgi:hypothetical protein